MADASYLVLEVKAIDAGARTFSGFATTPGLDLGGDRVNPFGVRVTNPIPLLMYHDRTRPIGTAVLHAATPAGIPFTATLADVPEPGVLRDRVLEAWHSIKAGLAWAVSIGWRPLENGVKYLKDGTRDLLAIQVHELSIESLPMNPAAVIDTIKSLAAAGRHSAGVSALSATGRTMTIAEAITGFENRRAALVGQMNALMDAHPGQTLDADEADRYDGLALEVKTIDGQLTRERTRESLAVATATKLEPGGIKTIATGATRVVSVTPNVPPGQAFVRKAMAIVAGKGSLSDAIRIAEQRWPDMPEVALSLKSVQVPATTTDAFWAKPLVNPPGGSAAFMALLRPATVIGRIPGLRDVPFNVPVPIQTGGGTYNWVGEGKPKPLTQAAYQSASLTRTKIAGILLMTEELARSSDPKAEEIFRQEMIAGIGAFKDAQFLDPAVAEVVGLHPGSITNGIAGTAATADPAADIAAMLGKFAVSNIPLSRVSIVLSEGNAFALSMFKTVGGEAMFPGVSVAGGTVGGVTLVPSNAAGSNVIGVAGPYILYADDGEVEIDVSREATVQMESAPMSPADATVVMTSLWQNNLVGLRAELFANWKRVISGSVQLITGAAWTP